MKLNKKANENEKNMRRSFKEREKTAHTTQYYFLSFLQRDVMKFVPAVCRS